MQSRQTKRSKPKAALQAYSKCKHQYSTIPKLATAVTYYMSKKQQTTNSTSTITAAIFNICLTRQYFQTYFRLGRLPKK